MKIRHCVGVAGAMGVMSLAGHAAADTAADQNVAAQQPAFAVTTFAAVQNIQADGSAGRLTGGMEDMGPGAEQAVVTYVPETKRLVVVWMMSFNTMDMGQNQRQYGPWQGVCKSFQLREDGAPTVVSKSNVPWLNDGIVRLSNNQTNRPFNHPSIANDGKNVAVAFGTNYMNNGRTHTDVMVVNSECQEMVKPIRVSLDPNEDEGAPVLLFTRKDANKSVFTGAYASNNGNDIGVVPFSVELTESGGLAGLTTRYAKVTPDAQDPTRMRGIIYPTNVARPLAASLAGDRTLICAAKGDNRPPEVGVECVNIDYSGNVLWRSLIAPSNMNARVYMNQPSLAVLPDGKIALNAIESNAMGRGTNNKGLNLTHLYMLEPNADAFVVKSQVSGLASYQTHAAICSGRMGESGNVGVGVISASPSGVGRPMFMTVSADTNAFQFARKKEWPIGFYGDSGHLANWYGANPMKQGRDFLQCIGDVPNLGYHKQAGFMADVETFFIAAHAGRVPGNMKNSLDLSIIPGKQDREAAPQNPRSATDVPLGETDPNEKGSKATPKEASGCACSTPGSTSNTNAGGLAMLALGLGVLVSRRKKS